MSGARTNDVMKCSDVLRVRVAAPAFFVLWILSSRFLHPVRGEVTSQCSVVSDRCSFPFTHEGHKTKICITLNDDRSSEDSSSQSYCKIENGGDRWAWGVCDKDCFKKDGSFREFSSELSGQEVLCKSRTVPCVFPFIYNGDEYSSCTVTDSDKPWCATQVDPESGEVVPHMWANCSEKTCSDSPPPPRKAVVKILPDSNPSGVEADISFEQQSPGSAIFVTGTVSGLTPGKHGFHIHQRGDVADDCNASGPHFDPLETERHGDLTEGARVKSEVHAGDFGNIDADHNGVATVDIIVTPGGASIFDDDTSILQRTLVIHEDEDDLGTDMVNTEQSLSNGNAGTRLACGIVELESQSDGRMLMIIIIAVLAVVIIGLIILIVCLICRCVKKKRMFGNKRNGPVDGLPDNAFSNGNPKRGPLYDELSIPFIDASPAPSPKMGRSTDRLTFLLSRTSSVGRSKGSLSNEVIT